MDNFSARKQMQTYSSHSPPLKSETVITVSALNQAVAQLLERNLPLTWVSGEISNFTRASSGHWYFTLKDSGAQVRAVMFKGRSQYANFMPKEGDKVEVRAIAGLYAPRGDFQINVESIRRAGIGNLFEAFLKLKSQLELEGLFDQSRKQNLAYFVRRIGIITSPQAAALRDVLATLQRRAPHAEIILYPTPVQGEGAGVNIAKAIATADSRQECDVLIVCRGGGSIEDLWSFNEEVVARTIAHCTTPIISGVGHETDFTICDFVADIRAATPTAAAELAITSRSDWLNELNQLKAKLQKNIKAQLNKHNQTLDWTAQRLQSPLKQLAVKKLTIEQLTQRIRFSAHLPLQKASAQFLQLRTQLRHQTPNTKSSRVQIQHMQHQLTALFKSKIKLHQNNLKNCHEQLEVLSPQRTLERGYVILRSAQGELIRSGHDIQTNQELILSTSQDQTSIQVHAISLPIPQTNFSKK